MTTQEFIQTLVLNYRKKMTKLETDSYTRIITRWNLTPEQLEQLFDALVTKRLYFPRPDEINETRGKLFPTVKKEFKGKVFDTITRPDGSEAVRYTWEYLEWQKGNDGGSVGVTVH